MHTPIHTPIGSWAELNREEPLGTCSAHLWDLSVESSKVSADLPHCFLSRFPVCPCFYPLSLGFLQVSNDTKLVAVPGPVPGLPPCCKEACELPAAFISEATHFEPIVLTQDTGITR